PSQTFFFSSRRGHTGWPRDWSSDVCSSDLRSCVDQRLAELVRALLGHAEVGVLEAQDVDLEPVVAFEDALREQLARDRFPAPVRSEERRVGKECRSRCAGYQ